MARLKKGQTVTFDHHDGQGHWRRQKGTVLAVVNGPVGKDGIARRATVRFGFLVITGIPGEEFQSTYNQNIRNLKIMPN